MWRQLVQDGTKAGAQLFRVLEEACERIVWVLQLLHVREKTAGLHRVQKPRRRLLAPSGERFWRRQTIETVVDFNRIEGKGVVGKPSGHGELGWIEIAAPVFVLPA